MHLLVPLSCQWRRRRVQREESTCIPRAQGKRRGGSEIRTRVGWLSTVLASRPTGPMVSPDGPHVPGGGPNHQGPDKNRQAAHW
eukprot:985155-Pyramimonas_sp.AAC.1